MYLKESLLGSCQRLCQIPVIQINVSERIPAGVLSTSMSDTFTGCNVSERIHRKNPCWGPVNVYVIQGNVSERKHQGSLLVPCQRLYQIHLLDAMYLKEIIRDPSLGPVNVYVIQGNVSERKHQGSLLVPCQRLYQIHLLDAMYLR